MSIIDQGLVNLETEIKSIVVLENNLLRKKKIEKNSSLFNIKFFSLKKNYEDIITDKDKFDPTVDFFYEKFEKLKVSVFRYEFEPKKRNDVFEKYYFFTYKIIDKNDNPEPIVRIIASSKKIYNDIDSCYADANRITVQYKDQKEINDLFIVSDLNNNEYRVRISSTCFESFFSSKFHFNLVVGIYERNVENNNYYALLNLMGYKFKDINTLKKKDIKF